MNQLSGVRRSPRLLKRLLSPPVTQCHNTPKRKGSAAKRQRPSVVKESTVEDHTKIKRRKKEKDFVDGMIEAFSSGSSLSDSLNVSVCEHGDEQEYLVVVTTKRLYYHDPAEHISRLRLVLNGTGSYYIQVILLIFV